MSETGGRMDWTAEKIAQLTAAWLAGTPASAIAEAMGLSKNAVVGKAHRLNLRPRPSPIIRDGVARPAPVRRVAPGTATLPPLANVPAGAASFGVVVLHKPPPKLTGQCCWPIGEPRMPGFRYCDAPCAGTYCAAHAAIAFVRPREYNLAKAWPR